MECTWRGWRWRSALVVVVLATGVAGAHPAGARDEPLQALTIDQIVEIFDVAELPGLAVGGSPPAIMGDPSVDDRIRALGTDRGYRRRPSPTRELESVGRFRLQPEAAAGWRSLQNAAADAGHSLTISSAFRSESTQASIFRGRLAGTTDAQIESVLRSVAVPGYSKHHTGYAVDIRSGGVGGHAIKNTEGFRWLSEDNFANARAHGWLPSYPEGADSVGPDPEPWEWVWVGATNIGCAVFEPQPDVPFCDVAGTRFEADILWLAEHGITTGCTDVRYCTGLPVTRVQASTMLWRLAGEPSASATIPFVDIRDGAYYVEAIRWMVENEITTGTTPTTFEPDRPLTRAEFVTFLWRMSGRPVTEGPLVFVDVGVDSFAAMAVTWASAVGVTNGTSPTTFAPDRHADRAETAAFIHRSASIVVPA